MTGCEVISGVETDERYPLVSKHFQAMCRHEAFAPDVQSYMDKIAASN